MAPLLTQLLSLATAFLALLVMIGGSLVMVTVAFAPSASYAPMNAAAIEEVIEEVIEARARRRVWEVILIGSMAEQMDKGRAA